ncbi:MAG: lytic transglycosylase domain-containing protein [Nocardioides sp.]|uniref:lytic transglycosylase domain-containing protein n=1 Tax=Nocardioides sp. TaxID=35761 RepID=UPI0039E6A82F
MSTQGTNPHRLPGRTRIGTGRTKRIAALVPLAMLSAAWTVSISTSGASTASADDQQKLPDGSVVPSQALSVPASVTSDSALTGVTGESPAEIVSTASYSEIPAAALAAYQRAETVINKADPSCHLPWQLLAAIGRVESNHGRAQGNTLTDTGLATPGIVGVALDGTSGTSLIADTDGGSYDGDTQYDRAVGPLQFIPSTWSTVGVDADGDGTRDPQDINDASLAGAVYLCSGEDDLSTDAGRRAAVLRYNHSQSYVETVLSVYEDYLAGDFSAIPNYVLPASYFEEAPASEGKSKKHKGTGTLTSAASSATATAKATTPSTSTGSGSAVGGSGSSGGSGSPSSGATSAASSIPSPSPVSIPTTGVTPVDTVLTKAEATAQCLQDFGYKSVTDLVAALTNPANLGKDLPTLDDLNACVAKLIS